MPYRRFPLNSLKWQRIPLLIFIFVIVLSSSPYTQAQNTAQSYRLVEPQADDYGEQAEAILRKAATRYSYWEDRTGTTEFETLANEIYWRWVEQHQTSYRSLIKIYRALANSKEAQSSAVDDRFIPRLIEKWIAEQLIRLDRTSTLSFDDFLFNVHQLGNTSALSLTVRRAPFDGAPLYHTGFTDRAANYIVVRDEQGHYLVPELPVPMDGNVLEASDLNADGQPDFAYLNYSHAGNSYTSVNLDIVTWTGEQFETLAQAEFRYGAAGTDPVLTWNFAQLDDDKAQELMTTQLLYDNWGCNFIRLTYYDWKPDGTLYLASEQDNLPKSFSCLLRQAEQKLWTKHYSDAPDLYQQAFAKPDGDAPFRYLGQIHFGLVDLLNGNKAHARLLFSSLNVPSEDQEKYSWVEAVKQSYLNDPRLLPVCQAIYNQALDISNPYRLTGTVYISDGGFYGPSSYDPGLNLENVSCNLTAIMQSELAKTHFSTAKTPVVQLQELGLKIGDFVKADLDQDGDEDWVVWIDSIGIDPMLFTANGSEYTRTMLSGRGSGDATFPTADMRQPDAFNQYRVIHLPDGHLALMNVDFGHDIYAEALCSMCGGGPSLTCADDNYAPDTTSGMGDLTLWRLEGGQLTSFFFSELCGWGYQTNLFPDGEGGRSLLAGDEFILDVYDSIEIRPVKYEWDEKAHTYVAPPQPPLQVIPTPTLSSAEAPQSTYSLFVSTFFYVQAAFTEHDYAHALEMIDGALSEKQPTDPSLSTTFHYYRALTLEALHRPDEALKEYVAIYQAEPDSAWGMMANLHLEKP